MAYPQYWPIHNTHRFPSLQKLQIFNESTSNITVKLIVQFPCCVGTIFPPVGIYYHQDCCHQQGYPQTDPLWSQHNFHHLELTHYCHCIHKHILPLPAIAMLPTTATTHATRAPFVLTAMTTLATPMDTMMTAMAMTTMTTAMTTIFPAQCQILLIITATDQQLLYNACAADARSTQ
uniref:Uncharacterized protein n=1 Tax=Romanomermis culicivorax TaxID=13658 RepID=A0A915JDY0_ROMCU